VRVTVMQIGVVRMLVGHRLVPMPVSMGFAAWIVRIMRVLMVNIVRMSMLVLDGLVLMLVVVNFGQVQVC
jgi:hypothetical protein